ncbi:unnamed protein product [Durusdinium trenchii]|uniref:PDZ domain-containing protein n=1 Tax=Durusdinium trenchii TaxID=1381693 RepID=A0ABP0LU90_9DINO
MMETEWKAKTGKVSLLARSGATVRLAYNISRSVKKLEHELASRTDLDKEIVERRWNELHRKNAKMVHQHILKYRGLLTKFGQAASTKAGSLPAPWVEELRGLQDELPISNFQDVVRTIKADLGRPLEDIFRDFGQRPIASASVGQAHLAWLRKTGQKVCVKVQHHGVGSLMKTDLATIEFCARQMLKRHPDAPDFTDVIREWRRASREEVDFLLEAKNALQALNALRRHNVDVTCPEPIQSCCSQRVLTMVFIEGWKITDLDRMPYGADRETLARDLVHAFALLVFQEGLIHGDPHPGNVFVEPVPGSSNGTKVRPVLLDWGIVKHIDQDERYAAAKWIVSTLSQDRQLYVSSLLELGFEFDADPDMTEFATFIEASMSQCAFMFRDSIPSSSQMNFLQQMQEHQEREENQETKVGKEQSRLVGKIPGVVLFFLRGLEMLQNICGMLEVTVPFASIMLENCMPLLVSRGLWDPAAALPGPPGQSVVEQKVRAKLHELDSMGLVLGAQVAAWDRRLGSRGDFLCNVACGRIGPAQGIPISDQTVMPLMSLSAGPLLHCLLRAISQPTVQGKQMSLETSLGEIWPDFFQKGKNASIGDVLQHKAGLAKPFPSEMTIKGFCNETRLEEHIAASPSCLEEGLCPVWGELLAALLKRLVGRKTAQEAISQMLEPVAPDVTYRANHTALAGRRPQERVTMQSIYEWLEEKVESLDSMTQSSNANRRRWLSETELAVEKPWIADPLIVNRQALMVGHGCLAGRGLRASAKTLCRVFLKALGKMFGLFGLCRVQCGSLVAGCCRALPGRTVLDENVGRQVSLFQYLIRFSGAAPSLLLAQSRFTSGLVPAEMLEKSLELGKELKFQTLQQWWDSLGARQRAVGGWQLFPFKTKTSEVQGYGFADGVTGSIVLRLPEVTMAILLSSCSPETRHVGRSLLDAICTELGYEAAWPSEPPPLPKRAGGAAPSATPVREPMLRAEGGRRADDLQQELTKVEAKVTKLSEVLDMLLPGASAAICGAPNIPSMAGFWLSDETEGLESLLEALQVPAMMRSMASAARRTLQIDIDGNEVQICSTTSMLSRQLEETTTRFQVGHSFSGEQALGGSFTATASWIEDKEPQRPASLHLVKIFTTEGFQLDELFELLPTGRLALTTTLSSREHQFGDRRIEVHQPFELEAFCDEVDQDLILKRQVRMPLTIKPLPAGSRITGLGPVGQDQPDQAAPSLTELRKIQLPVSIFFTVESIRSTTFFCQEGGSEGLKTVPSELLESLPPEIRTALAERQANQSPSPSSAASPHPQVQRVQAVQGAPGSGSKEASTGRSVRSFCWSACATISWASCRCLGQGLRCSGRAALHLCGNPCRDCKAPNLRALMPSRASQVDLATSRTEEYMVLVDRSFGDRLGLRVDKEDGELIVIEVQPGLVQEWNSANHGNPNAQVREGDVLLEVNGQTGDARTLMDLCKGCQPLQIKLQRTVEPQEMSADKDAKAKEAIVETEAEEAEVEAPKEEEHKNASLDGESAQGSVAEGPAAAKQSQRPAEHEKLQPSASSSQAAAVSKPTLPKITDTSRTGPQGPKGSAAGPRHRERRRDHAGQSSSSRDRRGPQATLEEPVPGATFRDPRSRHNALGIVAFSRLDATSALCRLCRAQVLSNGFDLGGAGMAIAAPCSRAPCRFRNAEAAYQATSNWPLSGMFQELSATAALRKVQRFGHHRDKKRAGFGSSWCAMQAVLTAKFEPGTPYAAALVKTEEAFLLEAGDELESDADAEDVCENWLGALLMILRDKLSSSTCWSSYLQTFFDVETGRLRDSARQAEWQKVLHAAQSAVQSQSSAQLAEMDPV